MGYLFGEAVLLFSMAAFYIHMLGAAFDYVDIEVDEEFEELVNAELYRRVS